MKNFLLSFLLLGGGTAFAQPVQTLYAPNGKKYMEGHWTFTKTNLAPKLLNLDMDAAQIGPDENAKFMTPLTDGNETVGMWPYRAYAVNDPAFYLHILPRGTFTMWNPTGTNYLQTTFKDGVQEGPFAEYYAPEEVLQKGNLVNGMPNGNWTYYYKNNKPYYTGTYKAYSQTQMEEFWAQGGVHVRKGKPQNYMASSDAYMQASSLCEKIGLSLPPYDIFIGGTQKNGPFRFLRREGNPWVEMEFLLDEGTGTWKIWRETGDKPALLLQWKAGAIDGVTDSAGKRYSMRAFIEQAQTQPPAGYAVFTYVDQMPAFPGDLKAWLAENMRYPKAAAQAGLEGSVTVKFIAQFDGTITYAKVEKGVQNEALNAEALRLVNAMPRWKAGHQSGRSVRVWTQVPIDFKLP